jgi:hypothetical protein
MFDEVQLMVVEPKGLDGSNYFTLHPSNFTLPRSGLALLR